MSRLRFVALTTVFASALCCASGETPDDVESMGTLQQPLLCDTDGTNCVIDTGTPPPLPGCNVNADCLVYASCSDVPAICDNAPNGQCLNFCELTEPPPFEPCGNICRTSQAPRCRDLSSPFAGVACEPSGEVDYCPDGAPGSGSGVLRDHCVARRPHCDAPKPRCNEADAPVQGAQYWITDSCGRVLLCAPVGFPQGSTEIGGGSGGPIDLPPHDWTPPDFTVPTFPAEPPGGGDETGEPCGPDNPENPCPDFDFDDPGPPT